MPIEVKLGGAANIDQAARSLLRLRERVDTARVGEPAKVGQSGKSSRTSCFLKRSRA